MKDCQTGSVFVWQKKLASENEGANGMDTSTQGVAVTAPGVVSNLSQVKSDYHSSSRPRNYFNHNKNKSKPGRNGPAHVGTPQKGPQK